MGFSLFGSSGSKSNSTQNTTQNDNKATFGDGGKYVSGGTLVSDGAISAGGSVSVTDGGAFALVEAVTKQAMQTTANASDRLAQSYATAQPATQTGRTYALALGVVALLAGLALIRHK